MNIKTTRIEIRVEGDVKRLLERAAALRGQSVSSFVLTCALPEARVIVDEHERTHLSPNDWEAFDQLLANPPRPNRKLLQAIRKYAREVMIEDGE
jgi:uncharacterized protein (DUF1778 family)